MSNYQIATLIKVSILNATNRQSVSSVGRVNGGVTTGIENVARTGTANRTGPIAAVGTYKAERTIAVNAETRHGQF